MQQGHKDRRDPKGILEPPGRKVPPGQVVLTLTDGLSDRIDDQRTAKFRELCLLATSATYRAQESPVVSFSSWWCRDEYLSAMDVQPIVEQGLVEKVLQEKAQAVADWKRVEQMAREIQLGNAADQEFLEVSSTYGRIKMAITASLGAHPKLDA